MVKHPEALDLNELLEKEFGEDGLKSLLDLMARQSWWVSPRAYSEVQVVYPATRRKKGKEARRRIIDGVKVWENQPASRAFWLALGKSPRMVKGFHVCHIYSEGVQDPKHFTNLANLTALPAALESLTEWRPVRKLLMHHSFRLYGYRGLKDQEPEIPPYYPIGWPHVDSPDPRWVPIIVTKLREQAERRPQGKQALILTFSLKILYPARKKVGRVYYCCSFRQQRKTSECEKNRFFMRRTSTDRLSSTRA